MAASVFAFSLASTALLFWTPGLLPRTAATPVRERSDSAVPYSVVNSTANTLSRAFSLNFTEHEAQCLDTGQVLYDGACYRLLWQGPCNNTEWLVMDKQEALNGSGALVAVCRPRPCPADYHLVTSYWQCFHNYDIENIFCRADNHLIYRTNMFGVNHCQCLGNKGHLLGSADKASYSWYRRGPCGQGLVLVPLIDLVHFGFGTCRPAQCSESDDQIPMVMESGEISCYVECPERTSLIMEARDTLLLPGMHYMFCSSTDIQCRLEGGVIRLVTYSDSCVLNNDGTCVKLGYIPLNPYSSLSELE